MPSHPSTVEICPACNAEWVTDADRYRAALDQLRHLVVSPGDMDRDEICAEGRRLIDEALR